MASTALVGLGCFLSILICTQSLGILRRGSAVARPLSTHRTTKLNSMAFVHKRIIPTERPPLVGEVDAKFCG
jgi:hypothetical protein